MDELNPLSGDVIGIRFVVHKQGNTWTKSVEIFTDKGESQETYSETKTLDVDVLIGELESL